MTTPASDIGMQALQRLELEGLPPSPLNYLRAYYEESGIELGGALGSISADCLAMLAWTQTLLDQASDQTGGLASRLETGNQNLTHSVVSLRAAKEKNSVLAHLSQVLTQAREILAAAEEGHRELMATRETIRSMRDELDQARTVAHEDPLTGAQNRRGLGLLLEQEIARSRRKESSLTIAMLDLDHFKRVNDEHGHHAGDQVLVHFASLIRSVLRDSDVLARYGGEEFTVLLPETDPRGAMFVLGRLQQLLSRTPMLYEGRPIKTTFSAGVATLQSDENSSEVLRRADTALYAAKTQGRNRIVAAAADSAVNSREVAHG